MRACLFTCSDIPTCLGPPGKTHVAFGEAIKAIIDCKHLVALGDAHTHGRAHGRIHASGGRSHVDDSHIAVGLKTGKAGPGHQVCASSHLLLRKKMNSTVGKRLGWKGQGQSSSRSQCLSWDQHQGRQEGTEATGGQGLHGSWPPTFVI